MNSVLIKQENSKDISSKSEILKAGKKCEYQNQETSGVKTSYMEAPVRS